MPRILAIDWDRQEMRCLLASATGDRIRVLWASAAALEEPAEGSEETAADLLGRSLQTALGAQGLGRPATVVGVHRAGVEMLDFTLPPATDAELALLVYNQALREAHTLDDEASLDFLPLNDDPRQPRQVVAAVLAGAQRKQISQACAAAGVRPSRIVLRPLAAASLFARTNAPLERLCLLVSLVADEADLTILVEGRVVFLRTVRLPAGAGEEATAQRLWAEIARTLVVAQQGALAGGTVERAYLYGGPGEHQTLLDQLPAELNLAVTTVDPFASADVSGVELPPGAGRFASLLGMAVDESRGSHAIDFLHPRRPPRPPHKGRVAALAAGAVAILVLLGGTYYGYLLRQQDAIIAKRKDKVQEYEEALADQGPDEQLLEALDAWSAAEIVWLDELRDLSRRFPPARDAVVLRMSLDSTRRAIGLTGRVRESGIVAQIDRSLTDEFRRVRSRRVGHQEGEKDPSWRFESSIFVDRRAKEAYRDPPGAKP